MKILVTGGVGFIGHNLVAKLERKGHEVCVLDNFTNYGIVPTTEISYLHQQRLDRIVTKSIHHVDIRDASAVREVFQECKPDMVIHCAAYPRAKAVDENPIDGIAVLTVGLVDLLQAAERYNTRRFVYISSSMVYGDFDMVGYEDMTCNPKGLYGIYKYAGEKIVEDLCTRSGMDYVILRPSAVYGPRDVLDRVVSKFIIGAMHNREIVVQGANECVDFTSINDCVQGIYLAAMSFNSRCRVYNITRGRARTLLEAAELAVKIVGGGTIKVTAANPRFPSRGTLSNLRAGQDFGYHGRIDIEQGFREYYEWAKNSIFWNKKAIR
jgi:nucleoside-diphosphate-sugar epimerase